MSATERDRETVAAILREHNCEDLAESPMAARIAEALAAARRSGDADTERLDWLEEHVCHGDITLNVTPLSAQTELAYRDSGTHRCVDHGDTLRAAIDAAMGEEKK